MSSINHPASLPTLGFGLGLRASHIHDILEHKPRVDWFEIISENYMENEGKSKRLLERIAEHYPIVMHGVSLSIGGTDPLNIDYLQKLKALMQWVRPAWISDHVCFTGVAHKNTHDLLPLPYTQEALSHIVSRIKQVQDILESNIAFENPSTYLEFTNSSMPEAEFIARMVDEADCNLLLDVNNVYVSCFNHHRDTKAYLDALPLDKVIQIHLSGHSHHGSHILDTHDDVVIDDVWALYRYVITKAGRIPNTMIEWDANIPEFPVLYAELEKARNMARITKISDPLANFDSGLENRNQNAEKTTLQHLQSQLQTSILSDSASHNEQLSWIRSKPNLSAEARLAIYATGYRLRCYEAVREDYPVLARYLGEKPMDSLLKAFVEQVPSHHFNLAHYSYQLPDFLRKNDDNDEVAIGLARLERSIARVTVAPESIALEPHHLSHLTPDELMQRQFITRNAFELLEFPCDVNGVYRSIKAQETFSLPQYCQSFLAIYRHEEEVFKLPLEPTEAALLHKLSSGIHLGDAIEAILSECHNDHFFSSEQFSVSIMHWLPRWIKNGVLAKSNLNLQH